MKYAILLVISALCLSSCVSGRDPWGNKQTRKERRALNEMGCPQPKYGR